MKYVIFDFDGTLADSLPIVIDIAKNAFNIKINNNQIEKYRNMTAKQVLKEAGIPIYKVPGLLVKGRPLLQKRMPDVQMFPELLEVIEFLHKKGHSLYVVSSNSAGIINQFLENYRVRQYFRGVYGNVGVFSKAQALKKVIKREGLALNDAVYVGDEVRDIEASKKIGLPIISVTWGYNGKEVLSNYHPDYMVNKAKDLLKIING